MSVGLRKRLNVIKNVHDHLQASRSVREARREEEEEDGEEDEGEYEEEAEMMWGSREDAEMFLSIFDLNRDGKLSRDELWGFFEALSYTDKEINQILEKFSAIDTNSDSFFSVDELMMAMQLSLL
ncbi:XP_029654908.1uncharacterized protein LOC115228473 [Octopus vulgaris]|uniref:XP_029654908.1uncharacterized protein LOC115228473 n=2 Tax=Octopus TaxID=6643 RepID=A0AA36BML6_OCTVU|nr:XP_029654908.1uncharacterized protein LOC115228473 [Octopus vulgaris]